MKSQEEERACTFAPEINNSAKKRKGNVFERLSKSRRDSVEKGDQLNKN